MGREVDNRLLKLVQASWSSSDRPKAAPTASYDKREVIAVLLRAGRNDLANAVAGVVATLNPNARRELEKFVWSKTPKEYQAAYRGRPAILHMGKTGTKMSALASLSDNDLFRLATRRGWSSTEQVHARPGVANAAGSFDYEGSDCGVLVSESMPNLTVNVYYPLENVGKRGSSVDMMVYRLWVPHTAKSRTAWGATLLSRLKAKKGANASEVARIIRSTLQEAEKESILNNDTYQVKFYEPSKTSLKGVDPKIPDPSTVQKLEDRSGADVKVRFKKPNIWIYSERDAKKASDSRMERYITVNWAYAKKVASIADALVKLSGLGAVTKLLDANKIKYKLNSYMDPMWS
jgi:hypothetical protein